LSVFAITFLLLKFVLSLFVVLSESLFAFLQAVADNRNENKINVFLTEVPFNLVSIIAND